MAQGDLTPQAIHRLQRYSNTAWNEHRDFSYGMCQDLPSYASPESSVYDAVDYLFDTPGKLRKRGGWTTPMSSDGAVTATHLGRALNPRLATGGTIYLADARPTFGAGKIYSINTSTGAKTIVDNTTSLADPVRVGRCAEHLGTCLMPMMDTTASYPIANTFAMMGATAQNFTSLAHPASASVVAGNQTVTIGGGDTTSGLTVAVGQIFTTAAGVAGGYIGRVDKVVDATHFTVWPTPTTTFTPGYGNFQATFTTNTSVIGLLTPRTMGGLLVSSFQNRVLMANTVEWDFAASTQTVHPNRVVYSILPDETPSVTDPGTTGAFWLSSDGYEPDNFFDIAATSPIISMSPVGEGQMVFFSATECFRLTGQLTTQNASSSGVSIDVRRVSSNLGCLSDRGVQLTPRGLIFPSLDGVYAYDGSQFHPLMNSRISNLWRDYIQNNFAIPVGAAIVRGNHYVVTLCHRSQGTTVDTFICNLDTLAWGRLANTPIGGGIPDVLDQSIAWASHMPSGNFVGTNATRPLIRLDPMFNPSSGNRADGNTTAVVPVVKTRSYTEGDPNTRKRFRRVQVEYDMRGGTDTLAVASDTKLKVADASYTTLVTGGGASSLAVTTTTTEATFDSMSKLKKGVAIEHQITQSGTGSDSTEILGIKHGFQQLRDGRST